MKDPVPCIFAVSVLSDGIGDVLHYIDFLALLKEEDLTNGYFVIRTELENDAQVKRILEDLDSEHPLQKFKDRITFVNEENEDERVQDLITNVLESNIYNLYMVSHYALKSALFSMQDPIGLTNHLYEHNGDFGMLSKSLSLSYAFMGLYPTAPGIFVHPKKSALEYDPESTILQRLGITDQEALTICYSHGDQENAIIYLCKMNQKTAVSKPLVLLFLKTDLEQLSTETLQLLENSNCRLINHHEWISTKDFEQLKVKEAKTATFGLAAGDKSTETCFSEGLFPLIQSPEVKDEFWKGFIETLNDMNKFPGCVELFTIMDYIEASISTPVISDEDNETNDDLLNIIGRLDQNCFDYWRNVLCPYVRENFNLLPKIPHSVRLFRGLAEILQNPDSEYARIARGRIISMPKELYDQIILEYCQNRPNINIDDKSETAASSAGGEDEEDNTKINNQSERWARQLNALLNLRDSSVIPPAVRNLVRNILLDSEQPHARMKKARHRLS